MAHSAVPLGRASRFRWFVVGLLFVITTINYVDRTAISFAIHDIAFEYGFDKRAIGLILGAFGGGYFVTTLVGGVLA